MKKIGILLLLIGVVSACKKEDLSPSPDLGDEPVFSVIGTIDGQAVSFQGGVDNAFLTTYSTLIHGVERYSGKLTKGDDYVDFGVFNGNLFLPGSTITQVGGSLKLTSENTIELLHVEKSSFLNSENIQSVSFTVDGENVGNVLTIVEPGIYEVCASVIYNDVNQTQTTICNEIVLGYKDLASFVIGNLVSEDGYLVASINNTVSNVNNVEWYVDNVLISNSLNFSGFVNTGIHALKAKVTFANGIVKTRNVGIFAGSENYCLQDITTFKKSLSNDLLQDFKAQFSVKLNGVEYKHVASASSTQVVINEISYFGKNAANKDVYRVAGVINTPMRNMTTNLLTNAQFNIVFGLEIP